MSSPVKCLAGSVIGRYGLRRVFLTAAVSERNSSESWVGRSQRTMATRCLNMDDMNPNIKVMEYAVRGPLVIRAAELEKELEKVINAGGPSNIPKKCLSIARGHRKLLNAICTTAIHC